MLARGSSPLEAIWVSSSLGSTCPATVSHPVRLEYAGTLLSELLILQIFIQCYHILSDSNQHAVQGTILLCGTEIYVTDFST